MNKKEFLRDWTIYLSYSFTFSEEVANFVACQFALESNFGRSNIFKINHNICGMKLPRVRISTAIGETNKHAQYICVEDSVFDYVLWLSYSGFTQKHLDNLDLFKNKLKSCGFCPASDYIDRIINLKEQFYD